MNTQVLRYILFLVGAGIGGYIAYRIGNQSLVNIISLCKGLLEASFLPVVLILLFVIFALIREQWGLEDSFIGALRAFAVAVIVTAVIPLAVTIGASNVPAVRGVFCADCATPKNVSQLIDQGKADEAYALASTFIENENKRIDALPDGTPAQVIEFGRGCVAEG
ncbi:MAG: hypothetical protein ACK46D_07675, partial [Roseiflexaceae bacterium]